MSAQVDQVVEPGFGVTDVRLRQLEASRVAREELRLKWEQRSKKVNGLVGDIIRCNNIYIFIHYYRRTADHS